MGVFNDFDIVANLLSLRCLDPDDHIRFKYINSTCFAARSLEVNRSYGQTVKIQRWFRRWRRFLSTVEDIHGRSFRVSQLRNVAFEKHRLYTVISARYLYRPLPIIRVYLESQKYPRETVRKSIKASQERKKLILKRLWRAVLDPTIDQAKLNLDMKKLIENPSFCRHLLHSEKNRRQIRT